MSNPYYSNGWNDAISGKGNNNPYTPGFYAWLEYEEGFHHGILRTLHS